MKGYPFVQRQGNRIRIEFNPELFVILNPTQVRQLVGLLDMICPMEKKW